MTPKRLSNSVRHCRFMACEMTQSDLAERVGVTRQTIAAIEQGKYAPSLETAFKISDVFGKSLLDVFSWEEQEGS